MVITIETIARLSLWAIRYCNGVKFYTKVHVILIKCITNTWIYIGKHSILHRNKWLPSRTNYYVQTLINANNPWLNKLNVPVFTKILNSRCQLDRTIKLRLLSISPRCLSLSPSYESFFLLNSSRSLYLNSTDFSILFTVFHSTKL